LFQKINCGFFVVRKTLSFPPKQSAQDSTGNLLKSKPASPTKCTFNGADASAFYRWNQRFCVAVQNIFSTLPLKSLPSIGIV
jgi:hypothetical protein